MWGSSEPGARVLSNQTGPSPSQSLKRPRLSRSDGSGAVCRIWTLMQRKEVLAKLGRGATYMRKVVLA